MTDTRNSRSLRVAATIVLAGATGLAAAVLLAAAALTVAPRTAEALPQYAQQTGLPCAQCHVNPAGGGKLKPFGQRFKAKGHKL
jgi:glycine/D-amino acid oxidase-like deaminating enzyme